MAAETILEERFAALEEIICAALTKAKVRVGTKALRIASIAFKGNATLLTRNPGDFARVPTLRFANWTI